MSYNTGMDPWLAQVYGTGGATEDLEKTAQYMLLEKLAAEEGVDLSGLPPEQIDQMAEQVSNQFAQEQGGEDGDLPPEVIQEIQQLQAQGVTDEQIEQLLVQHGYLQGGQQIDPALAQQLTMQQQGGQADMLQKEAQAKFEEADFLGRVMAHAYHQELTKIAAEESAEAKPDAFRRAGGWIGDKAKAGYGHASAAGKRYVELLSGGAKGEAGAMAGRRAGNKAILSNIFGKGGMRGEALKSLGARVGTAGGLAAAGYGLHRAFKKSPETEKTAGEVALEKLAEMRAMEILRQNGYQV